MGMASVHNHRLCHPDLGTGGDPLQGPAEPGLLSALGSASGSGISVRRDLAMVKPADEEPSS
jgi:hypothetical protein